jgi:subtilisin family serine protease
MPNILFSESNNPTVADSGIFTISSGLLQDGTTPVVVMAEAWYYDEEQYTPAVTTMVDSVLLRESDSNDSIQTADTLPLDETVAGHLSTKDDKDYFAVSLSSSGTLLVTFDGPTSSWVSTYFYIDLYDAGGTQLDHHPTGIDVIYEVAVDRAGTYYLLIEPARYYSSGEYLLTVGARLDDPIPEGAIRGTVLSDIIAGTSGDDTIYGLGGNDLIDGAAGNDTVVFPTNSEYLKINTIEGLTAIRGYSGAGDYYAGTVSRLWNVENLETLNGTVVLTAPEVNPILGTRDGEVITGTSGDDLIDGLGGADSIDGSGGDDIVALFGEKSQFTVQTVAGITHILGSGSTSEYAGHTVTAVNVEKLAFIQEQTLTLETSTVNKIFGTPIADQLTGTGGDDVFDGREGNDVIDGGAGSDTVAMFGKLSDFNITYPGSTDDRLIIQGKEGTVFEQQTVTATNIETIAFLDCAITVATPPKVVLSPSTTLLAEGGLSATLSLSLSVAPSDTVNVNLNGGEQLTASSSHLVFDASNWSTPQTITVSATDDTLYEKQHTGTLTVSLQTADPLYTGIAGSHLSYSISDNDPSDLGVVSGMFWNDANRNGVTDSNEGPLSGWTVFDDTNRNGHLDDDETSVTSDLDGRYTLGDLEAGEHTIVAEVRKGWVPTWPDASPASPTMISSTQADSGSTLSVETLMESVVTEAVAQETYSNLGTLTNISSFHADSRFADVDGQGYSVVIIDTGIDLNHPYFGSDANSDGVADRIVYSYDFSGRNDADGSDLNGHGTHVAGIIGSSDSQYPGIAPGVNIIALKVFTDSRTGDVGAIGEALNWVVQHSDAYNIVALNMSIGFEDFNTVSAPGRFNSQFKALANSGVIVVAASGNGYADEYDNNSSTTGTAVQGVCYPSSDPYALSVGAVWSGSGTLGSIQTGVPDAIAAFSQRDDELSDIFAPGVFIESAALDGTFVQMSGTSMASPEIAGMVALGQQLAEEHLGRRLTFDEVRDLLNQTGVPIVDGDDENDVVPNTGLTFKRVDMLAFAEAILALDPPVSYTVSIESGGSVDDRNFGFAATEVLQGTAADDLLVGTAYGDVIRGGDGVDQINGGDGDDELYGEAGDDLIQAGAGDDSVDGGSGDDMLYGGEGIDTAFFGSRHADYLITVLSVADRSIQVTSTADGTDTLYAIEYLRFADERVAVAGILDPDPPIISTFSPSDGADLARVDTNIVLTFNEAINRGAGSIEIHTGSATGPVVESYDTSSNLVNLSFSGNTLTIDPTNDLAPGTHYYIRILPGSVRDLAGNGYAGTTDYDFMTVVPSSVLHGSIRFWKSNASLQGVTTTVILDGQVLSSGQTGSDGLYEQVFLSEASCLLGAAMPPDDVSMTEAIKASDALAALKIAVGLSPNDNGSDASNYQLIAADVNKDGRVTAGDALGILKMAVKLSSAPAKEWLFVPEGVAGEAMTRTSVNWSETTTVNMVHEQEVNLVGIVKGDVNGNWAP